MSDTFGVCGQIALIAANLLINNTSFKDLKFDPIKYKKIFEQEGSAWPKFYIEYPELTSCQNKLLAIKSISDFQNYINVSPNHIIGIAIVCDYPLHGGKHTHWLVAKTYDQDHTILLGDLSPLKIKEVAILVDTRCLANKITKVLNESATTIHTQRLQQNQNPKNKYIGKNGKFISNSWILVN